MFNSEVPSKTELPTTGKLLRSTLYALVSAGVILITIVLPAEYAIDPTGIGRVLGLTEMGEIKMQLDKEAEADRQGGQTPAAPGNQSSLSSSLFAGWLIGTAHAQAKDSTWKDEISVTLKPGQGAEVKLSMAKGAKAEFSWTVKDGAVNYDLHGDGGGQNISYKKDRKVEKHSGTLEAAFDGNHGWFWRNRGRKDVTVILRVRGDYTEVKRMI
ncbi:MAG TPA: transmembrane anchor protein [Rhodospirillaceae bacterium]|nr:transmembrane anchor protein [Rhodospirillaceae bacterium]|tara:strand:+ start:438 stop:1076 length:639 start_codon:yes stop_codon:yes gene_type:complete